MKKLIVLLSFLFVFALVPSVFAQTTDAGLLPDSPIYFLKPFSEKVRGFFTFGEDSKAQYALTLVDKRLSEAKALSDKGENNLAGSTAEQAGKENENAQEHLAKAKSEGKDITAVVGRLAANSSRQQALLEKVFEKAPEQSKAAIKRAMEVSKRGLTKAQEMQIKEKGGPKGSNQPDRTNKPPEKPNGDDRQGPGGQGGQGQGDLGGQGGPKGQGPGGPGGGQGQNGPKGQGPSGGGQGKNGQGPGGGGQGQGGGNQGGGNGGGGQGQGGQGQGGSNQGGGNGGGGNGGGGR